MVFEILDAEILDYSRGRWASDARVHLRNEQKPCDFAVFGHLPMPTIHPNEHDEINTRVKANSSHTRYRPQHTGNNNKHANNARPKRPPGKHLAPGFMLV